MFGQAIIVDHIAEPVRGSAIPGYKEVKKEVLEHGACGCNISGGGSSIFAVCEKCDTSKIAEIMERGFAKNPLFEKVIITSTSNLGVREL